MNNPRIVHISSLPPTACGVAEYTAALAHHMQAEDPSISAFDVRLDFDCKGTRLGHNKIIINPSDGVAIDTAAETINRLKPQAVSLQHEFKLYGGTDGNNVVRLLQMLEAPVITTLHAVCPAFTPERQRIFFEVLQRSASLIVFSQSAARMLAVHYGVETRKVRVIPHGVPDVPFRQPEEIEFSEIPRRKLRLITTGLLRPAKGIEHVLAALAEIQKAFTDFAYMICGIDHPRNPAATEYRKTLLSAVLHHGLENHVFFVDRFLDWPELVRAIQACDVGILAYTSPEQSSSGVLALTLGCGRPVIATDFQHARAVVNDHNGIIVPACNVNSLASAIALLARDVDQRRKMAQASYDSTRSWIWPEVAQKHFELLNELNGESLCASASLR